MKRYQAIYVHKNRVINRKDIYTNDAVTTSEVIAHFEKKLGVKLGEVNPVFDVTVERIELVEEGISMAIIEPEILG